MQHSLTHAPLFMHGEPEPSYSLHLFRDADRISLKEVEVMENLHRELALKRQAQQENRISRPYMCARRPYSSQSSDITAELRKLGVTPPQHDESSDELLIGAARRLNHIVDDRKASWRVVPTTINQQYPTSKYLYPKKGEWYKRCTPSPTQNYTCTSACSDTVDGSPPVPGTFFLKTQANLITSVCRKESSSHDGIEGLTDNREPRKGAPLLVVTSPETAQLRRLSVQSPTLRLTHTSKAPPASKTSRTKSLKSISAWMNTLPNVEDVECVASLTPVCKAVRQGADFGAASSPPKPSEETQGLALSPAVSCTLTLSS
ncbi:Hypothetical protein GLP15_1226 [Giardia lamblia P15]|uniref:Uncharacterized protein n=1 Tax=Giardia intestinalis (strain P15) TaxID=658858 RepID=E1EZT4_GIAIA|nr:Hypothetical protein GLP15_1226 [Giardia lamblia P15]